MPKGGEGMLLCGGLEVEVEVVTADCESVAYFILLGALDDCENVLSLGMCEQ